MAPSPVDTALYLVKMDTQSVAPRTNVHNLVHLAEVSGGSAVQVEGRFDRGKANPQDERQKTQQGRTHATI